MAIKRNQVACDVRVKLGESYKPNSLGDKYLSEEQLLYISDEHVYNDSHGEYVWVKGGSGFNSGIVYLKDLELEFPIQK